MIAKVNAFEFLSFYAPEHNDGGSGDVNGVTITIRDDRGVLLSDTDYYPAAKTFTPYASYLGGGPGPVGDGSDGAEIGIMFQLYRPGRHVIAVYDTDGTYGKEFEVSCVEQLPIEALLGIKQKLTITSRPQDVLKCITGIDYADAVAGAGGTPGYSFNFGATSPAIFANSSKTVLGTDEGFGLGQARWSGRIWAVNLKTYNNTNAITDVKLVRLTRKYSAGSDEKFLVMDQVNVLPPSGGWAGAASNVLHRLYLERPMPVRLRDVVGIMISAAGYIIIYTVETGTAAKLVYWSSAAPAPPPRWGWALARSERVHRHRHHQGGLDRVRCL